MGNYSKWHKGESHNSDKLTVVLFISRNKDNKEVANYTERRNAFVTTREPHELEHKFNAFVNDGLPGEMVRMYVSVNPRSNSKTFKALQHAMLDNEYNLATLPQRVAAFAAKKENAYDSSNLNWLFDFDPIDGENTEDLLQKFLNAVEHAHLTTQTKKGQNRPEMAVTTHKTPHGYAVVVDQRFDTRELLSQFPNVELKRDDLLCYKWATK